MTASASLHSLLDYERRLFCVTDLVLIYESVTSSASVVRWLTLHSWTLNFWIVLRLIWGALSDERTGLSFTIAAGPRQRSHFQVRVP
jgi:hypothetical protein